MTKINVFGPVGALLGDFGRARRAAATYERLSRLSDDALARRGLTRGEVPLAAYRAGFGA